MQLSLAVHSPEKSFWGLIFFLANQWANKVPFDLGTRFYFGVFPQNFFVTESEKKCLQILYLYGSFQKEWLKIGLGNFGWVC